ncbi:MAG: hypothetical protein ACOX2X_06655 [Peptococcia bacterium]
MLLLVKSWNITKSTIAYRLSAVKASHAGVCLSAHIMPARPPYDEGRQCCSAGVIPA